MHANNINSVIQPHTLPVSKLHKDFCYLSCNYACRVFASTYTQLCALLHNCIQIAYNKAKEIVLKAFGEAINTSVDQLLDADMSLLSPESND